MRHRKHTVKLDRRSGPRRQLLRGLARNVLLREHVLTTAARARAIRPLVERCITIGKRQTLVSRRRLHALLSDPHAVGKVIEVLGPRYQERPGGYTRTIRTAQRAGDGAQMVRIELV